ncbi:MAG: VCBS repeat-containing protein [Polyangiaceae bacterium]|nr:VCBS repeat-containing protein [Polyangiaceae bacterium]
MARLPLHRTVELHRQSRIHRKRTIPALGAILTITSSASADPPGTIEPTPRTIEIQETCSNGGEAAISEIACELANALAATRHGALIVSAPPKSEVAVRRTEELGQRVAHVLAGRLRRGAQAASETADLTRARALASAAGTLVHLTIAIEAGEIRVAADVFPVPARFWERVRDPRPSPVFHAFASRRLDPEVRTFLPPVPIVATRVDRAELPESHVVSLACEDLDADGASEFVVLGRQQVVLGRIRNGKLERTKVHLLADLSPVAQSPLREPLGSVTVIPGAHADVGTSDRAYMLRFDSEFRPEQKPGRRLPWPAGGCSRFSGSFVGGEVEGCVPEDPKPAIGQLGWNWDAIGGASVLDRNGKRRDLYAGRRGDTPEVVLRDGNGRTTRVSNVGAQLAVADLDGDGTPELLTSLDTLNPAHDAVVVRSWLEDGGLEERLRIPVPEGVRAIGVCPHESETMAPIAIATMRQLWVVR